MKDVMKMILDGKMVAIIRGVSSQHILPTVEAMVAGGIDCVEVTFNAKDKAMSEDTLVCIRMIKEHFGDRVAVGAGTVLTVEDVERAAEAGAEFMISPNTDAAVIQKTKAMGLISIPGAVTPTEILHAHSLGADIVKLFPAATLGLDYIKAVTGPINHVPLTAVGGIDADNAMDFIKAGCVGVSVGGNLVNKKLILEGRFDEIENLARAYQLR